MVPPLSACEYSGNNWTIHSAKEVHALGEVITKHYIKAGHPNEGHEGNEGDEDDEGRDDFDPLANGSLSLHSALTDIRKSTPQYGCTHCRCRFTRR